MWLDFGTLSGLIGISVALLCALDLAASDSLKNDFAKHINSSAVVAEADSERTYALATRAFSVLFGQHIFSLQFVFRSICVTLVFLIIMNGAMALLNDQYYYSLISSFYGNSKIPDIIIAIVVGTALSDLLCFSKTIFFVKLFQFRINAFGGFIIALADLLLSIFIYVVTLGVIAAVGIYLLDRFRDKTTVIDLVATSTINTQHANSPPFQEAALGKSLESRNITLHLSPSDLMYNVAWIYQETEQMQAWRDEVKKGASLQFIRQYDEQVRDEPNFDIENFIKKNLGVCSNITYEVVNPYSFNSTAMMNIEGGNVKDFKVQIDFPFTMKGARINVKFGRVMKPSFFPGLWALGSNVFLSQYVTIIQSAGFRQDKYLLVKNTYANYLSEICQAGSGFAVALLTNFAHAQVSEDQIERYAMPIAALPYAGLIATIFFHMIAALGFLGRLLLPRSKAFVEPTRAPFTIVGIMGSVLVLTIYGLARLFLQITGILG